MSVFSMSGFSTPVSLRAITPSGWMSSSSLLGGVYCSLACVVINYGFDYLANTVCKEKNYLAEIQIRHIPEYWIPSASRHKKAPKQSSEAVVFSVIPDRLEIRLVADRTDRFTVVAAAGERPNTS